MIPITNKEFLFQIYKQYLWVNKNGYQMEVAENINIFFHRRKNANKLETYVKNLDLMNIRENFKS